jgi:hypothetical protein
MMFLFFEAKNTVKLKAKKTNIYNLHLLAPNPGVLAVLVIV